MDPITRRDALKLTAASAAALGTALGATTAAHAQGAKINAEPPVASTAKAESTGPTTLWAVVDADGKLQRGQHAASAQKLANGFYEVIFSRDVRRGVYVATAGGHGVGGLPPVAMAGVSARANNPRGVLVTLADAEGDPINGGFHLLVMTPERWA